MVAIPSLKTARHVNPVPCLLIGCDGPIELQTAGSIYRGYCLLADSRTPHSVDSHGRAALVVFLEHPNAQALPTMRLADTAEQWALQEVRDWSRQSAETLWSLLRLEPVPEDPRIDPLVTRIDCDPMHRLDAQSATLLTGLERTTMLKRFKRQTGMTFRRFKSWSAIKHAANALLDQPNVATTGIDAGFADAAHFSRFCRNAFGYSPTMIKALLQRTEGC
jgi:AraC-like DNA-binding protein